MARETSKQKTKPGNCPTHGAVQAVKDVPVFSMPGVFYVARMVASPFQSYRCPQCGAATR